MRADAVRVALRPRSGWEAVDLGFVMARHWWKPLWAVWLAAYVPLAVALTLAFWSKPVYAAVILWWLKPAFDRAALHVLSRAVFGEQTTVRGALASADLLRPGLLYALTLGRLSAARSFLLPVAQLEQLTGRAAAARRSALGRRERGFAVGLTLACIHFELVVLLALDLAAGLLTPAAGTVAPDFLDWIRSDTDDVQWWSLADGFYYIVAVSVVEPLYVAGGFALYLNRRTLLEGWDIEVALRRLAERVAAVAPRTVAALAAAWCLAGIALPGDAVAAEKSPRAEIREVLKAPEFQTSRETLQWQYRAAPEKPRERPDNGWLSELTRLLAEVSERLGWVLAALAVAAALYVAWRYARRYADARGGAEYRPPDTLFGLAVAPESLPDDIAAAAVAAARAGRLREALSLLYRGALSALVNRHRIRLEAGDTEGDCVRLAARALERPAAGYFAALVGAWQSAAYAGRDPDAARVEALAEDWRRHFGGGGGPPQGARPEHALSAGGVR